MFVRVFVSYVREKIHSVSGFSVVAVMDGWTDRLIDGWMDGQMQ